jgi:integrase
MANTSAKLTKEVVDSAKPRPAARYIVWDKELRGFGVRIEPSGVKTFFLRYRAKGAGRTGLKRFLKIGRYGPMTTDQARRKAKEALGAVAGGDDPAGKIAVERQALTVADLVEHFLESEGPKRKAGTARLYSHYLRKLAVPEIGRLKAHAVTNDRMRALHSKIGATRPVTANRVLAALSGVFEFGLDNKLLLPETVLNPTRRIRKFGETPRERYLTTEELDRLGAALREAETVGVPWRVDLTKPTAKHIPKGDRLTIVSPFATAAIRLLLFTGCRLREILHLRWSEVDFERGMLHLPDSKSGKKSIVLNATALDVLSALPRLGDYVIAGDDPAKPRADLHRPWGVVTGKAGLKGLRIHDLRHSFASLGAGASLGLPIIGKLLGHASPETTARYAHLDADPLRRASNAIGATIAAAMGEKAGGRVIQLPKAPRAKGELL